jgi:hypothetical protein
LSGCQYWCANEGRNCHPPGNGAVECHSAYLS